MKRLILLIIIVQILFFNIFSQGHRTKSNGWFPIKFKREFEDTVHFKKPVQDSITVDNKTTGIYKDGSNNLVLYDANIGAQTLTDIATAGGGGEVDTTGTPTLGYFAIFDGASHKIGNKNYYDTINIGIKERHNTNFGLNSLNSLTTAYGNTAFGWYSLYSNSSANYNTAFGEAALYTNSTGIQNTAVGASALFYNTNTNNSAFGFWALRENSSGSSNTGIGQSSLTNNETGSYNSAIGHYSLQTNISGSYNMASGAYALQNSTGSNNIGVGYFAGGYSGSLSNRIYFNVYNQGSLANDSTKSWMYGYQDTNPIYSRLKLNGDVYILYDLFLSNLPQSGDFTLAIKDGKIDTTSTGGTGLSKTQIEYTHFDSLYSYQVYRDTTGMNGNDSVPGQWINIGNGKARLDLTSSYTAAAGTTQEEIEDYVGGMVTGNTETNITVTYQDADGTLDFVVSAVTDSTFDEATIHDTLTVEDRIKLTKWTMGTDSVLLMLTSQNLVDTIGLVPAADTILNRLFKLKNFDIEYEEVMNRESLPLPIINKKNGNIENQYRVKGPYLPVDMQLLAEIEKLYRRVYELSKRVDELESNLNKKPKLKLKLFRKSK